MKKTAIIICSRRNSRRIPEKPFQIIGMCSLLQHLINRLIPTNLPIIVAVPVKEHPFFREHLAKYPSIKVIGGPTDDPLARMAIVAKMVGADNVVRVCHDKIFVDAEQIKLAVNEFNSRGLDYLFSSSNIDGAGFEICSTSALALAASRFRHVEHISYAVRAVVAQEKMLNYPFKRSGPRLLVDYPEDLKVIRKIIGHLGNNASLEQVTEYWHDNRSIFEINEMPRVSVYTCVFNGMPYIKECIASVVRQTIFKDCEYIFIDDDSTDDTLGYLKRISKIYGNITCVSLDENQGLASASNKALELSRGKYVIRLDHDDYFTDDKVLDTMANTMDAENVECLYPANYFGSKLIIQPGDQQFHVGGSMFNRNAINHIKFTDGLREYEGWDFFERAKDVLSWGTVSEPTFMYRQRHDSLSKQMPGRRIKIAKAIKSGTTGSDLCNL